MKHYPENRSTIRSQLLPLALIVGLALPLPSLAASVALATLPLATSTTSTVKPNVLFVLDDSGSMSWTFMPDVANDFRGVHGYQSGQCNGVYYNPDITYLSPVYADGTSYPNASFTAARDNGFDSGSTARNLDSAFIANRFSPDSANTSYSNWGSYLNNSGADSLGPYAAHYYTYSGSQTVKNYNDTGSTFYTECNSAFGVIAGSGSNVFTKISLSSTAAATSATIVVSGTSSTSVSSIKVNGTQEIMSGISTASTSSSTVATNIAAQINLCTSAQVGNCTTAGGHGYTASTPTAGTVTLTGLAATATTLIITKGNSGTMTLSPTIFPVADATKLQNFANWYSYYRTRMQMMKTASGRAFSNLNNGYRIGLMRINSSSAPALALDTFETTQRTNWYSTLYNSAPSGSTPLRGALADAGRYYAGKLAVTDPLQYSCQQNFTILSTDGYWNDSSNPNQIDGSTDIGNQDGLLSRPFYDGSALSNARYTSQMQKTQTQVRQSTSQLQKRTTQIQSRTSNLQKQISQLQVRTSTLQTRTGTSTGNPLQRRDSTDSGATYGAWYNVSSCTVDNSGATRNQCQGGLERRDSTDSGATYGAWYNVSSCTVDNSGATRNQCQSPEQERTSSDSGVTWTAWYPVAVGSCTVDSSGSNRTQCQTGSWSSWTDAASCTSSSTTECQYTATAWVGTSSCTPVSPSPASPYTVPTATECQTVVTTPYANAASCTVTTTPDGSGNTTQCQYAIPATTTPGWSAWANTSSCTAVAQSAASPYTVGTATECQTNDTGWGAADSQLQTRTSSDSGATWTAWSNAASCTVDDNGSSRRECQTTSSCTPGSSGGQTVTCQSNTTGPTLVDSCIAANASSANGYTATTCDITTILATTPVASCTPGTDPVTHTTTTCNPVTTGPTITSCTAEAASSSNNWTATTCTPTLAGGGSSNSLADVAMYYYQTDLRTPTLLNCGTPVDTGPLCENNVFMAGDDRNLQQHMTTFTLGLGANGLMNYSSSYLNDNSGDYVAVKNGSAANSAATPPVCSWQANGTTCNWPIPSSGAIENIDDLWHAAVNGHGAYFSATNPTSLSTGLSNALAGINARKGSAAAAATSTLNPVAGNNYAYVASYTTVSWKGNLEARGINTDTGQINENATWCVENVPVGNCPSPGAITAVTSGSTTTYSCVTPNSTICADGTMSGTDCWVPVATACTGTMNAKVSEASDTRAIKTANSSGTALINFDAAYATANPANFNAAHIGTLGQWSLLTAEQQTVAAGANLLNYLRGQYGYEDRTGNVAANRLYRYREAVLGDALESQPAFIGPPVFGYPYTGYSTYKTAQAGRAGTVFMGANDGMMHAFAADTGIERWAYVPSMVIPNLWKLADKNYATLHFNSVNGSPITSDIYCPANCGGLADGVASASWRTILVAGLNGGGRGYYALDITVPDTPTLLWEFTPTTGIGKVKDDDVGYGFGQPIITRKTDGTWVVLVTSGYNNTNPGNGQGYLYVLNASTGAIISKISTGVGSTATPSGLSKIAGWNNESAGNGNTVGYVYGGDLLGNVWRFDINSSVAAAIGTGDKMQFAILKDSSANTQPITTTPILGLISGKRVIFVGTGKYLETGDLTNTLVQTQYAIKDDDAASTLVNPRATLQNQTLISAGDTRTVSNNTVNFYTGRGWYVDFPVSGERVNIDSKLVLGTLLVPTIVPSNTVCSPGGYGWLNYFDYKTGGAVNTVSNLAAVKHDSTIVGVNVFYIGGQPKVGVVSSTNPTPELSTNVGFKSTSPTFQGKRVIWRELIP